MALAPAAAYAQGPDPDPAPQSQGPSPDPAPGAGQAPSTSAPVAQTPVRSAPVTQAPATPQAATPAPSSRPRTTQPAARKAPAPAPRVTRVPRVPPRSHRAAPHRSRAAPHRSKARERQPAAAPLPPYPARRYAQEELPGGRASALVEETAGAGGSSDARLILQIGMLLSLLYVAFLCAWFFATRHLRAEGAGMGLGVARERVRAWWAESVVKSSPAPRTQQPPPQQPRPRPAPKREGFTTGGANPQWTCEIAYQPGQLRFQAVMAPHDAAAPHVSGEGRRLRWPRGVRRPSTHELESAVGALFASIAAAGWEPVHSRGPWSERRFVWRQEGEPPTSFELVGDGAAATAVAERPAPPERAAAPARPRAPRGANRDAVLRTVAARPGVTLRDLTSATGVKRSSLPPLLRTLTLRGEIEKRKLPDGQTGYALPRTGERQAEGDDARKVPQ